MPMEWRIAVLFRRTNISELDQTVIGIIRKLTNRKIELSCFYVLDVEIV